MLAQVRYIRTQRMNSCRFLLLQVPLFLANNPKHLPAGRLAGVGRPAISNMFDTAGRRRAGIGSTHDARPMPRFLELT